MTARCLGSLADIAQSPGDGLDLLLSELSGSLLGVGSGNGYRGDGPCNRGIWLSILEPDPVPAP